jgi:hypothetical protein
MGKHLLLQRVKSQIVCDIFIFVLHSTNVNYLGLRCEWAKSKARADRWSEEVVLLVEEMRRVILFFNWKADWWIQQGGVRCDVDDGVMDGLHAYAAKQAHIMHAMAHKYAALWYPVLCKNGFAVDWPEQYIPIATTTQPHNTMMSDDDE